MKDSLGDRMKSYYEDRYRICLPRRTNVLIRVDGKSFHSYTKGCTRPYDTALMEDMDLTAKYMCENIQGAKMAYVQSDEISIILTDYDDLQTDGWFDNNVQKMTSISSSLATAKFNQLRSKRLIERCEAQSFIVSSSYSNSPLAHFDARVFAIPEVEEVINYFIWRQQDATRNSIQMAGQSQFSHNQLSGVSCDQIQEKLWQEKQINWNDYPVGFKRGRTIIKQVSTGPNPINPDEMVYRTSWAVDDNIPIFTQDREYITNQMQKIWRKVS